MNLRRAMLFAAVAEERSFTRAAARLNIAQPWLSAQVRKLEDQLGYLLFDRSKGGLELTAEGEKIFPPAAALLKTSIELRQLSRTLAREVSLSLTVGSHATGADIAPFALLNEQFASSYQDVNLVVVSGSSEQLVEEVRAGRMDMALVMEPFDTTDLASLLLEETQPYVVSPRGSCTATHLAPENFRDATLGVMRRARHPALYDQLHGPLERAGAHLRAVPEPGRAAMEHFVRVAGVSVLMVEGAAADYAASDLVARPLQTPVRARHVLVRRADLEKRAATRYWRAAEELVGRLVAG